jgi:uncharacterized protein YbjT (DUF2867 family)
MERILVTGSSGMVGSKVLKHLMRRNLHAIAGVRDINSVNEEFKKNIDFIHLDYNDLISIEKAKKIVDKIFLVPPMHPGRAPRRLARQQALGYHRGRPFSNNGHLSFGLLSTGSDESAYPLHHQ